MAHPLAARLLVLGSASLLASVTLTGCGSGGAIQAPPVTPPPTQPTIPNQCKTTVSAPAKTHVSNVAGPTLSGKVMAGSQPLIGAGVQLYVAGSSGNGSAPTAMLSTPLTTDSTGAFTTSTAYTCPFDNSSLYLVARGGKAGAGATTNSGTVLMTALGACSSPNASSNITINEATTVAGAYSLSQFLSAGGHIGASSTNASGVDLAANTAANLVNLSTGQAPGANFPTATATAPSAKINSLANVLNACIASSGTSSSACTQLYSATSASGSTPSNTLDAMLNLVRHPATNTSTLYTLSGASSAYVPALTAAPADWTLFVAYGGGGLNGPAAITLDSVGNVWVTNYFSVASLFTNTGAPVYASGITGYNLSTSYGAAVDVFDNVWIANEQSSPAVNNKLGSVTEFTGAGSSLSGTTYTAGGLNFPISVAIDTSGDYWYADYGNSHVTLLDKTGAPLSGTSGYTSSQLEFPVSIAVDSKCYGYLANQETDTVTKLPPDGSAFTSYIVGSGPSAIAVDGSDNVWSANYYGNSVGLVSETGTVVSGTGYTGGGIARPEGVAVDGSGSAWFANYDGPSLTQLAAASSSTPGSAISPTAGWGPDANLDEAYGIAIDASGNVWVSNFGGATITEFIGLATPVKTPLVGPVSIP